MYSMTKNSYIFTNIIVLSLNMNKEIKNRIGLYEGKILIRNIYFYVMNREIF